MTRRKKSAFFLGGADEIDESLGTSKEEQDRASKNQKISGYKGMRNSEMVRSLVYIRYSVV